MTGCRQGEQALCSDDPRSHESRIRSAVRRYVEASQLGIADIVPQCGQLQRSVGKV